MMKQSQASLEGILLRYLEKVLGTKFRLEEKNGNLPLVFDARFTFRSAQFLGRGIVFCFLKEAELSSPGDLAAIMSQLKAALGAEPVFVFSTMTSWGRDRLIQRRMSFVVPGTQLYLPGLLVDLRERFQGPVAIDTILPWMAQFLILYSLQIENLEGETVRGLARRFGWPVTTVSRAVRALDACGLITPGQGKAKPLCFLERGYKLWNAARQHLRSPVLRTWYSPSVKLFAEWPASGETALGALTNVAGRQEPCVAVLGDVVRGEVAAHHSDFRARSTGANEVIIEAWGYDPRPLASHGLVDPCSLALAYASEADERIESALAAAVKRSIRP